MPYIYQNNLYNTGVFEFVSAYSGDTTDLDAVATGSGVHLYKDVTVDLSFIDRNNSNFSSTRNFLENPFTSGLNIDILDIEGNEIYPYYLSGYKRSSFTFKESDNRSIFGAYAKNFAIKTTLVDYRSNEYSSEFYFYGNNLEITGITVTDQTGTQLFTESLTNGSGISPYNLATPTSGELFLQMDFLNNSQYTKYDHVDIYWSHESGQFYSESGLDQNYLAKTSRLNNSKRQTLTLTEDNLPELDSFWLTVVPYSAIGSGVIWTVGPCEFRQAANPINIFTSRDEAVLTYGNQNISGEKTFLEDVYHSGFISINSHNPIGYNLSISGYAEIDYLLVNSDFQVNGGTFYVNSVNNSVGVNTTSPQEDFHVNGDILFTPSSTVTPPDNGDLMFEATNDTTLTIKYKGSDGTVRSGFINLA